MINGHGDDAYKYAVEIRADFSSNIPYRNTAATIIRQIEPQLSRVLRYPDPTASKLAVQIEQRWELPAEYKALVSNGSAEAFYLLAHAFKGAESIISIPSFAEYEDACRLYRHQLTFLAVEELPDQLPSSVRTLWIALPNNPDGYTLSLQKITALCQLNPHCTIIIDNAYGELAPKAPSLTQLSRQTPNLVVVHSLTKTFAIPGLRLGYIVAHQQIIEQVSKLCIPWSVNAVAQAAGEYIIAHYDELLPDKEMLTNASTQLQQEIAAIEGISVLPSQCNFFLCRLQKGTAAQLKEYLVTQHGVLIRDASNFRGLTPQHFRIAVQAPEHNAMLLRGLQEYLNRFNH